MVKFLVCANHFIEPLRKLSAYTASPLFDLAMRLYISWFFFSSGLVKLDAIINGNFSDVVEKFDSWYPVVIGGTKLDPSLAAVLGTFGELFFPILLALGLFGRLGAAGLLVMSIMITFFTESTMFFEGPVFFESVVLFVITGSLFLKGPGIFSLDHLLVSALRARSAVMPGFKAQIGLEDVDTDLPGHESSGRYMRAVATGFWYTIIGLGLVHFMGAVLTLIPGIDLTPAMVTNMFSRATPETALAGYSLAVVYAYVLGFAYAITSQKMDIVYTLKKSVLWALLSGAAFMILHYALI